MRRFDLRARLLVLATTMVLLATLIAVLIHRQGGRDIGASPSAEACADTLLVLVPGNAEGTSTTPVGAGATVGRVRDAFLARARAAGRSVEVKVVGFRSASISVLRTSDPSRPANKAISSRRVALWDAGIGNAVTSTISMLRERASACPDQDVALAGYAQGAAVLHRTLVQLGTADPIVPRIVGAALVSDPDRKPNTVAHRMGRVAASSSAIGIERARRLAVADVPRPGTTLAVHSVCRVYDLVCDFRGQTITKGINQARSYLRYNSDQLDYAATYLVNRVVQIPHPRPLVTPIRGTVGAPIRVPLVASVVSSSQRYLRWTPTSALPQGLVLSSSGVLSGQAATTGVTQVSYTVRNTLSSTYSRPVSGTMAITISPNKALSSVGGDVSCTVKSSRTLWCWGDNSDGQLGIGSRTNMLTPTRVGSASSWVAVSAGGTHTCGIRSSGSLWCWGRNDQGQLGNGTRTGTLRPVQISPATLWSSVSANAFTTCAITRGGALYCWGHNDEGQLGNGDRSTRMQPSRVGTATDWTSVSAGTFHTCGTRRDGSLWCWGSNTFGQLGNGTTTGRITPGQVAGADWTRVATSAMNTCALVASGGIRCWGANTSGQLGTGDRVRSSTPVAVVGDTTYVDVALGDRFACGISTDATALCWGTGTIGQLGRSGVASSNQPQPVSGSTRFVRLGGGWGHACGTGTDGATSCWGFSSAGQVGDGTHTTRPTPVRVLADS